MSSATYTNVTADQAEKAVPVITVDYCTKKGVAPLFLSFLDPAVSNCFQCSTDIVDGQLCYKFLSTDATYVFPTQSEFVTLCTNNAIENEITREAKRIADFHSSTVNLRLSDLVLWQDRHPEIADMSQLITYLRPLVEAATLNPVNRALLNLPPL